MEQYGEALGRLEQFAGLEAADPANPVAEARLAFLMADSQRKEALQKLAASARLPDPLRPQDPDAQLAAAGGATARPSAMAPSVEQALHEAKQKFDQVIELYRANPAKETVDQDYDRLAYFYRAACLYELERYEEAIELYGMAAQRYGDDASALAACIQIANACTALGRTEDAALARERATWLLKRLGPEALTDTRLGLSQDYWEQWLATSVEAGAG
jgi:tetratricopeptide (TPR) repeat protein